jgi:hypothetical protein
MTEAATANAHHPGQRAAVLQAGELCRRPGCHAKDESGEWLDEQFLSAVGEHRNDDEDREPARSRLSPYLSQSIERAAVRRRDTLALGCRCGAAFNAQDCKRSDEERNCADRRGHDDQTPVGERVQEMTGQRR